MTKADYTVFADMRWPEHTGIGQVQKALVMRKPERLSLIDLQIRGSIGSPLSPIAVSAALACARRRSGVFFSAGFVPPVTSPVPAVITVHDLTHLRYYDKSRVLYYNLVFKPLYHRCSDIICVSDYTRTEFLGWSGIPKSKVHVIHNGVSAEFHENCAKLEFGYEYVLYAGNHRHYKNLSRLIQAYAASTLPNRGVHLVLTGSASPLMGDLIRSLSIGTHVHCIGRVSEADLPMLYRGALLMAYVSLYEGFGIPVLEAMASDIPVISSNTSAMPEVAGDAALFIDPFSVDSIKHALDRVAAEEGLRAELIGRGRERSKFFDWRRSADAYWNVLDRAFEYC